MNAQKATVQRFIYSDGYDIPCVGEHASGDMICAIVQNKNIWKFSAHGILIGDVTGTVYVIKNEVGNGYVETGGEGLVWRYHWWFVAHENGKPIFYGKIIAHVTVNANGEVTAEFFDKGQEGGCKFFHFADFY